MNHPSKQFELAPVGILRAAAWPIETIQSFGNQELASLALAASRTNDAHIWKEYAIAYQQVHEDNRQQLWQMTAADSWFMKALLLSNPALVTEVQRVAFQRQGKRTKKIRHLETALYRYLARAAGRTTPYGLWAGVSLVEFTKTAQHNLAEAQYSFTPDLRPFQTILRSLAQRSIYRQRASWRLNPTLKRQADGSWRFWGRTPDGLVEQREIESQEIVDILLEELTKLDLGTLDELAKTVAASPRWNHTAGIQDILYLFIDGGVLLGGLDLPQRFENSWEALAVVAEKLIEPDRGLWNSAIQKLHSLCDTLAAKLDLISLDALANDLQQAKTYIQELAQALGVSLLQLSDLVLHCDLGLPFRIGIDEAQQNILLQTLADYERCWIQGASPASAMRMAFRERLKQEFAEGIALGDLKSTLVSEMRTAHCHPEVITRLEAWERSLSQNQEVVVLESSSNSPKSALSTAPFGCLFAGVFESFQLVVHGISDDPVPIFARFQDLFNGNNLLYSWFQQRLYCLASQHQIQVAELQSPFEPNPNVLARPNFNILPIELWGASKDSLSLVDAKIFLDPKTQLPFLKLRSASPNPVAVFWFSMAAVNARDPISEQLLWTTFQDNPMAIFRAATVPMPIELTVPRFTPRIQLPKEAIVRPRRTVLSGQVLAELAQLTGIERFARWHQLAAEYGWPILLNLQIEDKPSLLLHRDSPLALESFFKKDLHKHTRWLIVEELVNQPWLVDAKGQHYMAELALPFARTEHGWSLRRDEIILDFQF
ncbi:lantibiotic dehydratase [Nostoc sp. C117]|uniref:lantibiotic dehydratase n=1 Tax=Nostoc sp. C117 TaxID=3349875 RepID=UPI00370D7AB0